MSAWRWSLHAGAMLMLGAASALGFAPLGWWPVWLGAVAVFWVSLAASPWQRQWWMGWVFGLAPATATTHWIGVALWQGIPAAPAAGASAYAWWSSAWPWGLMGMLSAVCSRKGLDSPSGPWGAQWRALCLGTTLVVA